MSRGWRSSESTPVHLYIVVVSKVQLDIIILVDL